MMSRLFFLASALYFLILLSGCTTAGNVASSGGVIQGMNKQALRNALLYTSLAEDPFLSGCKRAYYPELNIEIVAAESETMYFIFEDVYRRTTGCKADGDGRLRYWTNSYAQMMAYIDDARRETGAPADDEGPVFERPPEV
jgi:hypothetical protein